MMKKALFFISTMALCAFIMAQTTSNQFYKKIGETRYNIFTNSAIRNTVGFNPQTLNGAAVWTMGSNSNNRGAGINYYNANSNTWESMPDPQTGRIETETTGWGTHGFTEEGEIVVSHNGTTGLIINTRDIAGQGAWQQQLLQGPSYVLNGVPTTNLVWPTLATVGNTVHMVCVTGQWPANTTFPINYEPNPNTAPHGYLGFPTLPLYYRSTDGGKTWEAPRDFRACGMTNMECFRMAGDEYMLAVRGNHVVFLYYSVGVGFVNYMESKDGGDTWEKKVVLACGMDFAQYTDPADPRLIPTTASICIDENHKVHVAFSGQCRRKPANTNTHYNFWGELPVGMIYWNDSREPIDWQELRGWCDENIYLTGYNWGSYQGYIPLPSVIGLDKYYRWSYSPDYDMNQYENHGWMTYPNLLAKDGRVYLSYQSILDLCFFLDDYLRGIFITVSEDYGETWDVQNNTSWISYDPELLFADWSGYMEPTYTPEGTPEFYPADWVEVLAYSENSYPSMSYNYKGDLFMLQWANDLLPFTNPAGYVTDPINVYTFTQDLRNIPAYKNIQEVYKGLWNGSDQAIVYPPQSCEKPAELTATFINDENLIVLNWEKPEYISNPLLGYNVFCNGTQINDSPISETHFEVENPVYGSYLYQVSAVYSNCESNLTFGATVVVYQLCEPPVNLSATAENNTIHITWNEPENIDGILSGYNIYRDETQINEDLLINTEYIDIDLADGTYIYKVSAVYEHCDESDLTEGFTIVYVGIANLEIASFNMYPNPTTGELHVTSDKLQVTHVEIFDVYGKCHVSQITGNVSTITMDVSHLASGVYFVKIFTETEISVTKRLVIVKR